MDGPAIHPRIPKMLPAHPFLISASVDDRRTGLVTPWAQQCSDLPPMISVAIPRGSVIETIIRDCRSFGLTALRQSDRLISRRFDPAPARGEDPFVGMRLMTAKTGCPLLLRGEYWLDCELVGHLAPEGSHRLYIGHILASGFFNVEETDEASDKAATADKAHAEA
ncbi:MAG: flavin reductase family protein [Phycisphaerales bacterium]|nr:flavin reductase family protein [Phycisphaerales bacterium]